MGLMARAHFSIDLSIDEWLRVEGTKPKHSNANLLPRSFGSYQEDRKKSAPVWECVTVMIDQEQCWERGRKEGRI